MAVFRSAAIPGEKTTTSFNEIAVQMNRMKKRWISADFESVKSVLNTY